MTKNTTYKPRTGRRSDGPPAETIPEALIDSLEEQLVDRRDILHELEHDHHDDVVNRLRFNNFAIKLCCRLIGERSARTPEDYFFCERRLHR